MIRRTYAALLGLATLLPWAGAQAPDAAASDPVDLSALAGTLQRETEGWGPDYVVSRVAEHLARVPGPERYAIRYFACSSVPRNVLPALTSALFFGAPSLSRSVVVRRPQPVPDTDHRLYWIDLNWYAWTPEVWEKISGEDPYFREPLVDSKNPGLAFMKQWAGNAVVRADWFLYYSFDTTQFLKVGEVANDEAFYYQLIYGSTVFTRKTEKRVKKLVYDEAQRKQVEKEVVEVVEERIKGFVPRTAAEFEALWQVDFKALRDFPIDRGAIIDEGRSSVSYNNRILWRVRTKLGVYWRSFDVFRTVGDQDFVEGLFPQAVDGGEHIVQDAKGAQFYFLSNGAGKRVEFGDPRLVKDSISGEKLIVLTAKSCVACHNVGILSFRHELPAILEEGVKLKTLTPARLERVKQFYLQKDLKNLIKADQEVYANFVLACNGLTVDENVVQFGSSRGWYARPLDLAQAARELGSTTEELGLALSVGVKGRLGRLVLSNEPVPRLAWERGLYQEAGLLLRRLRQSQPRP